MADTSDAGTSDRVAVAVLISGRGSNMAALIEAAASPGCPYRVVLVFSNDLAAPGLTTAAEAGISTAALDHRGHGGRAAFDAKVDAILRGHGARVLALAGYMRLLSPGFVRAWQGRMLNIHPSLLPVHRGLDTHARVLAGGDTRHGCSVHIVTEELDEGPVIARAEVPVLPGDTAQTLAARVLKEEHRLYPRALADFVSAP